MDMGRYRELKKLGKRDLAQMVIGSGGLMTLSEYMSWTKEELIQDILGSGKLS